MAHGITDKDSMFSVQEVPWHGLGTVLTTQPKTIEEALRKSGLNWTVSTRPVVTDLCLKPAAGAKTKAAREEFYVPGWRATVRSDTGDVLGMVSEEYRVIQNLEALQFLQSLLGKLRLDTLGSLWEGKQVFGTAELPDHIEVGGDEIRPFLGFNSRHDGLGAFKAYTTPIRQVCANTVRMATAEALDTISIRHTGDPKMQVVQAREVLKMTVDYYKQFEKTGNKMASQKMAERQLKKVMDELYPMNDVSGGRAYKTAERKRELVMAIVSGKSDTVGNAPGSKWSAYNALIEVHDHDGKSRSREGGWVRKIEDPSGFKRRALELVTAA